MHTGTDQAAERRRVGAAVAVLGLHALLGWAVFFGARSRVPVAVQPALKLFTVVPPPPVAPPRPEPRARPAAKESGGAPAPRVKPSVAAIVAVPPLIPAPPVVVTGVPSGLSGIGDGAGTDGGGDGDGAGDGDGGGGAWTGARQTRGSFRDSDFPRSVRDLPSARVGVAFEVQPDGRVGGCRVTRPSGFAELDDKVCPVIRQRYRFEPARDDQGDPVTEVIEEDEVWDRAAED